MKTISELPISKLSVDNVDNSFVAISGIGERWSYTDRMAFTDFRQLVVRDLSTRLDEIQQAGPVSTVRFDQAIRAVQEQQQATRDHLEATLETETTKLRASIEEERWARVTADEAEAGIRLTLSAQVSSDIANTRALIIDEKIVRANAFEAEAKARLLLQADYESNKVQTNATILEEREVRASALRAEAIYRQTLEATMTTNVSRVEAAVVTERSARVTALEAEATAREQLRADFETANGSSSASIEEERRARAAGDEAEASERRKLEVTVNTNDTTTNARIDDEVRVRSDAISAEASRINTLLTSYETKDGVDIKVAAEAVNRTTAISSALGAEVTRVDTLLASFTGGGGNYVTNSELVSTDGWIAAALPANAIWGINLAGDSWHPIGENVLSTRQLTNGSGFVELRSAPFPVTPSSYIQFYVFAASHRSTTWVSVFYYNAAGTYISYAGENAITQTEGGQNPAFFTQAGQKFSQVPTDAVSARLVVRKFDTIAGQADSYAWFWRPYVGPAKKDQASWNPYVQGTGGVATKALIKVEEQARADAFGAEASRVNELLTSYETKTGVDAKVATKASVSDITTAISNERAAEASRVSTLLTSYATNSSVDTKVATKASVSDITTAISNERSAEVTRVNSLLTSYATNSSVDTKVATKASVSDITTAISNERSAEITRVNNLLTSYVSGDTLNQRFSAEISSRDYAISTAVGAEASRIDQVIASNDLPGLRASVTTASSAATTALGRTSAYWSVTADAGLGRAQLAVRADSYGNAGVDIVGDVQIKGQNGNGRTVISGSGVEVYDGNNVRRVRLGIF
jgi:hypothetical protein